MKAEVCFEAKLLNQIAILMIEVGVDLSILQEILQLSLDYRSFAIFVLNIKLIVVSGLLHREWNQYFTRYPFILDQGPQ